MKEFLRKYLNTLNWIPAIGILFFAYTCIKYKYIMMFMDEFLFWLLYQTTMVGLVTEIIKQNG